MKMRLIFACPVALLLALAGFQCVADAQNDNWIKTTGNWSLGSNWSTGSPPTGSQNAVITNAGGAVSEDVNATIQNLTLGSSNSLSINNGIVLTIKGSSISNSGSFSLNGGNAVNAVLNIGAITTLSGGGAVTLTSEGGQSIIQGNGFTLMNTNNTIQGYGTIGNGSLALTNGGIVDATQPALTLLLNGTGGVTNTNLLEATNGGVLQIQNTINNSGGNITANGGTVNFVGANIQGGILNETNNGFLGAPVSASVTLDGSTHGSLTLSSGSTYTGQFGSTTNIRGTINNNGNFQINGGNASNAIINLNANTTLQGGGTVTLSSEGGQAMIQGNGLTLTNTNNTIQGYGTIGNGSLALTNGGIVDATQSALTLLLNGAGGIINTNLLEATNGGVLQIQNTINNSGGNITANGGTVNFVGADIQGGTLNEKNNGSSGGFLGAPVAASVTLDGSTRGSLTLSSGSTYTGQFGSTTNVSGTIINNGNFQINGGNASNAVLNLTANATLQGNGKGVVTLSSEGGTAIIQGNGLTLTNSNNTIQGYGTIGNGTLSLVNGPAGTIFATQQGVPLLFNASGTIINNGTFKVASGATLHVSNGLFTNFAGTTLTGGTYNTGGTLQIDELGTSGGEIVTNAANIILSGTSSTFVDAGGNNALSIFSTNASGGKFTINNGRNFTTGRNFTNSGTLTVGTRSTFAVNVADSLTNFNATTHTLTGGTYIDSGTFQFKGANIQTIAANTSLTMSGASAKIEDQTGAANGLTHFATNNGTFGTASGFNFTTGGNFTNNGTLNIGNGTKFAVNPVNALTNFNATTHTLTGGTYGVTGTLQFNNANIVTNAANITLTGTTSQIVNQSNANALANFATNNGSFVLAGNRSLTTAGNFTNAGTLTVNVGSTFTVGGPHIFTQLSGMTTDNGLLSASGGIKLNGGSFFGTGSITGALKSSNTATVSPGASSTKTAVLKETGAYTQNSGILAININGKTPGTQYDQFNPTTATLSGILNITRLSSFVPTIGTTFKIMNFSSETGTFSTVNGTAINASEHFAVAYQPTDVLLTVVAGTSADQPASNFLPLPVGSVPNDSTRSTVVAALNTSSGVPDKGSTLALFLIALLGCASFHWYSTRRHFVPRLA